MRAGVGSGRPERPPHLRPGLVGLVAAGGAVGTLARYGVTSAVGTGDAWPVATTVENVLGALLLGALLGALGGVPETPRVRAVRLAGGTGVLGGFTTFSTLALEVERFAAGGDALRGVAYGAGSVVAGVGLAALGVALGGQLAARSGGSRPAGAAASAGAPAQGAPPPSAGSPADGEGAS